MVCTNMGILSAHSKSKVFRGGYPSHSQAFVYSCLRYFTQARVCKWLNVRDVAATGLRAVRSFLCHVA